MAETEKIDVASFRRKAIGDLERLHARYLRAIQSEEEDPETAKLERAARLFPLLVKTEENLLSSAEESEGRKRLEDSLELLFSVLRKVIGSEFDSKRNEILKALEAELKFDGR